MAFPQVASKITEYKTYLQYTRKVVADLEKNRDKVVDHIHEATEDIQSMEASICVLEDQRDKFVKPAEHVSKSSATEEDVTLLEANIRVLEDKRFNFLSSNLLGICSKKCGGRERGEG